MVLAFISWNRDVQAQTAIRGVEKLQSSHVENLFSIQGKVFSGGTPEGEDGFKDLQKLGIKTIISVDGNKPEVELAQKHGFRYIHIPMGYDGTSSSNVNRILKAAAISERPVFVHCHHGKHRGPAAAAVICEGLGLWDTNQAVSWLGLAGTSEDYPGLFKMAREFKKLSPEEFSKIPTNFVSRVEVSGLVDAMVEIDLRWDHLKEVQKQGYKASANHPDMIPASEAALLFEAYRELGRAPETRAKGSDFLERLRSAEQGASELHDYLKSGVIEPGRAAKLWSNVAQSCTDCHERFRN